MSGVHSNLFITVVRIGFEETLFTVSEAVGTVELCVFFMTPQVLNQVPDLEVFLRAATVMGTAGTLRLSIVY